ncbi:Lrp/AsnC family transcriptional regulator [Euzebya sp.]|uniref:Lrp/AsnC family transcriptional regulator n=1 Tax=Euzebya sp. TaxID=1971409 RepID=UPI003512A991
MGTPDPAPRPPRLDEIDRRILALLQDDARLSNAAVAREVGLTPPATMERTRRLEDAGLIRGYHADLDPEPLGHGMAVILLIRLDHHGRESVHAFRDAIAGVDQVAECHYLTGTADFLLKVRVADVNGYRRLLEEQISGLPGLAHVESAVVLETFKDDRRVPVGGDDRRSTGDAG